MHDRKRLAFATLLATLLAATMYVVFSPNASAQNYCTEIQKRYHVVYNPTGISALTLGQATMYAEICTNGYSILPGTMKGDSSTYWYPTLNGYTVWDTGVHRSYLDSGNWNYGAEYFYMHVRSQACLARYGEPCSDTTDNAIHLKVAALNAMYVRPLRPGDFMLGRRVMRPYWWTTCNDNTGCMVRLA